MTTTELPRGLEPWGEALAVLDPALAAALAPMVRALDALFSRRPATLADEGVPDGYDGLTNHGAPERIALSEWALAEEAPLEFLRRAATGELLHLAWARRKPRPVGRVVVLVDDGPGQHGAPRLAQLAALVVLHRRAVAAGGELVVGRLGGDPDRWLTGEIRTVLRAWRDGRVTRQPTPGDVAVRDALLEPGDEAWVLAAPELAAALRRPRVASIGAATWGTAGTATLHVDLDGDVVELTLPRSDLGVRAFRSAGYVSGAGAATAGTVVRCPAFPSAGGRLLARGEGANELLSLTISDSPGSRGGKPRHYVFRAPVVAAAHVGRRLVALLADTDGVLRVEVAGKALHGLSEVAVPFAGIDTTADRLAEQAAAGLDPLYVHAAHLLFPHAGQWWFSARDRPPWPTDYVAVAPGEHGDRPLRVSAGARGVVVDELWTVPGTTGTERVVAGGRHWVAVSSDGRTWLPATRPGPGEREPRIHPAITVDPDDEILALVVVEGRPLLATRSPAGLVVRLVGTGGVRTLTRFSGGTERPAFHPERPWIAVSRDGVVEVGDYVTGETLHVVRGTP